MKIFDLDMDYFMERIAHTPFSASEGLPEEDYGNSVWSEDRVRLFFEKNIGLSKKKKYPDELLFNLSSIEVWNSRGMMLPKVIKGNISKVL